MNDPSDWELLARYLSGECSDEEQAEVKAMIASDPEKQRLIASMSSVWATPDPHSRTSDVSRLWGEIAEKTGIATTPQMPQVRSRQGIVRRVTDWLRPRQFPVRRYSVAAAVVIACPLAYHWFQEAAILSSGILPSGTQTAEWATFTAERGTRSSITLSDGTRIRLDAGSTLRYPETFDEDERRVLLSGEGFFEVASHAGKPFVVRADHAVVEVLGTRFNVRAWQPEHRVTVAVTEGRVALNSDGRGHAAIEIAAGQMSILPKAGQPSAPRPADIERHLGWMQQEATFDNAPLHEILYQLERWYDVQFILEDNSIAAEQLAIHIQGQSLEDILGLISGLTGLEYQRTEGSVRLSPRDPVRQR
ncbi:MAG: FecR domain-containing protein [Candidatus Latescibacterota bacterium]|nr:FecR domain-containing protein [Candidatus Latescibacterota bacterium]